MGTVNAEKPDHEVGTGPFASSRECFAEMLSWLEGTEAAAVTHADLEEHVTRRGRELCRRMFQDHLDLRALRERPVSVVDANGAAHRCIEAGHRRQLATVVGAVTVERVAYRHDRTANLHPADAALNLPPERHSHGLRRLAAIESTRGSFDDAADAIGRATGARVAKRQVEQLTATAAVDVDGFYAAAAPGPGPSRDVLVLSVDGKGVVMRPESLRPATKTAADHAQPKLEGRLSKGEKRNRKRLAEVGAVYDLEPVARTPNDVMASADRDDAPPTPKATGKWVTASVTHDAATVVARVFDEAGRRDPGHTRRWIALVDGNNHQIDRINAEAAARHINVTTICDFIHVLEYLWGSAWCFFEEADPAAETWVRDKALAVLEGHATDVAAGIRRRATTAKLPTAKRTKADTCAKYLCNKAPYLDYPTALAAGWPIASGVIEKTCSYCQSDQ